MKYFLTLFVLTLSLVSQSQTQFEIKLSKTLNEDRMGVWTNGDYKVYIELSFIATSFRSSCKSYLDAALTYNYTDSNTSTFFNHTAKRYQLAAEQIEKANHGFDLRSLIVYHGIETEKENLGNSLIVESFIRQLVENGTALVFYKGKRIYKLMKQYESKGEAILDHGYEIRIYVNDPTNYVFKDYQHLGW